MRVIGAGFGRTGTMSLKAALEQLGCGPCFHMIELLAQPDRAPGWQAAADGRPVDWDEVMAGYASTVDWPGAAFYREMASHWPDAKVLLSVRDPDAWYQSMLNTIYAARGVGEDSGANEIDARARNLIESLIWDQTFEDRFLDREYAIRVFERHNAEVQRTIPADRLLVYEVKQGWEPLAEFLGTPVPDAPFPRLNDTAAFRDMVGMPALARR